MKKHLFIAEKPSVAREFAKVLGMKASSGAGYIEDKAYIVTWCVGHLITMSYPEKYREELKRWRMEDLPFIPEVYQYEVINQVEKQYRILSHLFQREDIERIYVCTDSGREGEYIFRLVAAYAGLDMERDIRRIWIDSQTEAEIKRGILEARSIKEYDSLASAAYLRAQEDYLMGINFSRAITLKYNTLIATILKEKYVVISIGRVMTCVLGMVVRREREIRNFQKTLFYKIIGSFSGEKDEILEGEWKVSQTSLYQNHPQLYKDNGFIEEGIAKGFVDEQMAQLPKMGMIKEVIKKKESKQPPLLFNLAELQNEASKRFKISPDETLKYAQSLYEKKLLTYPRTDARVLSSAVAKEIHQNVKGLATYSGMEMVIQTILQKGLVEKLKKNKRYINDGKITDHYAIIPTGVALNQLKRCSEIERKIFHLVLVRFLQIFLEPAKYQKLSLKIGVDKEIFEVSSKKLIEYGYLILEKERLKEGQNLIEGDYQKGMELPILNFKVKEGETSPPKRYNSGSIILAMENAGQLIEDEDLRSQIKGSGIGTSATRAEILKKLIHNQYLYLNKKTQVITPSLLGECIYEVVYASMAAMLNPELTASWERGLSYVEEGTCSTDEYRSKLNQFVSSKIQYVKGLKIDNHLRQRLTYLSTIYK